MHVVRKIKNTKEQAKTLPNVRSEMWTSKRRSTEGKVSYESVAVKSKRLRARGGVQR